MEELSRYREIIKRLISEYAEDPISVGDVDTELIFDEAKDHYELLHNGWSGLYRVHGPAIHIDIRGDKVWIQHDGTPDSLAERLVEAGIPRDRIVLGFKPPDMRPLTGFAAA